MLRLPVVAGQFYPGNPRELLALIEKYTSEESPHKKVKARACLVPHAGYIYSGAVAGAVFSRISLPKRILLLGVRHYPRGEALAILSEGVWRTPLGDVPIETPLAHAAAQGMPGTAGGQRGAQPRTLARSGVALPAGSGSGFFLRSGGRGHTAFRRAGRNGEGIARVLHEIPEEILIVTSSDMNHYEDDETTRRKDRKPLIACWSWTPRDSTTFAATKRSPCAVWDPRFAC